MTVLRNLSGWRKSSHSNQDSVCVEVRAHPDGADVRDTKNRDAGHLTVPAPAWSAFVASVTR